MDAQTSTFPETIAMRIGEDQVVTDRTSPVRDPATGETIATAAYGGAEEVERAVAAAHASFESRVWRGKTADEKSRILWRVAELIDANAAEFAEIERRTLGANRMFCAYQASNAAECFRYHAGWISKIHGRTSDVASPGANFAFTRREPVGVVGLITPWNFGLMAAAWKIAPALAAGCSAVVKPALETPLSTVRLGALLAEAGVPAGVVNIVLGGAEAGAAIAGHRLVRKVSFTGSGATAKHIIAAAASNLKRLTLELGGKSPYVICEDADLARAIPAAASVMFVNSGQACVAGSRLFVHRTIYDRVIEGIEQVIANIKIGETSDPSVMMGPLISEAQRARVTELVDSGVAEGARLVFGGAPLDRPGFFFAPTLFTDVTPSMRVMREEIFGPVVCATPYDDLDALMPELNDTEYGLAAYIWTRDLTRAHRFAANVEAGTVLVNGGRADFSVPFGGFKQSGWGQEHGQEGIDSYLETKTVALGLAD